MRAYLDHASTSLLRPEAREAMIGWLGAADPGRVHTEGRAARVALEEARAAVARLFGTRPRQVIFTSGATEAINAATYGALTLHPGAVAIAGVEHSAVREASWRWCSGVVDLAVDGRGRIDLAGLESALARPGVGLVQFQMANHEVGTVQPVADAVRLCRAAGVMVHVDAAAAGGHVEVDFDELGADLLSVSAHKLGGPAGVGALLVRRGLRVPPFIVGGSQERARRGGLENVAGAVGFGAACSVLAGGDRLAAEAAAARRQTDRLRAGLLAVDGVVDYAAGGGQQRDSSGRLWGAGESEGSGPERLPHIVCVGVEGVEAEPVLIGLDRAGVAAHSGSSCASEDLEPSPVLAAMGVDGASSLRFSVGWSTTEAEIDRAIEAFAEVVAGLRRLRGG